MTTFEALKADTLATLSAGPFAEHEILDVLRRLPHGGTNGATLTAILDELAEDGAVEKTTLHHRDGFYPAWALTTTVTADTTIKGETISG